MSRRDGRAPRPACRDVRPETEPAVAGTPAPERAAATARADAAPRRLRGLSRRRPGGTLAFVESPVQLLNVLEWAHQDAGPPADSAATAPAGPGATPAPVTPGPAPAAPVEADSVEGGRHLTIVVLSPHDPMTRGQLRRVAELARDEGIAVRWEEARGGPSAPLKTVGSLAGELRRARRVVIGDPFSRYVQLMLTLTAARSVVVVDDGTATMEFVSQLAHGERLVRWHRKGAGGARDVLFAPFSRRARSRLTPGGPGGRNAGRPPETRHSVEIFSSMPVDASARRLRELGVTVKANDFAWTRARFGPPRLTRGTDLVGTSLVETGVVDLERYLEGVAELARRHGATRYFAHRRESSDKLARVTGVTGLEIVRPDLPLELVARRGPIGRTILSFPSTVVHTLPLALAGTPVTVAVCDVDRTWLTPGASPHAEGFLSGVTGSARNVRRLGAAASASESPDGPTGASASESPDGATGAVADGAGAHRTGADVPETGAAAGDAPRGGSPGASPPGETVPGDASRAPSRPPASPRAGSAGRASAQLYPPAN